MSHKNRNPVNPTHPKRVAIVLSNPAVATTTGWPVGFWWAALTHSYVHFTEKGYAVAIFSPDGGACAADPLSDPEDPSHWQAEDVISRGYKHDPSFMTLLENTRLACGRALPSATGTSSPASRTSAAPRPPRRSSGLSARCQRRDEKGEVALLAVAVFRVARA